MNLIQASSSPARTISHATAVVTATTEAAMTKDQSTAPPARSCGVPAVDESRHQRQPHRQPRDEGDERNPPPEYVTRLRDLFLRDPDPDERRSIGRIDRDLCGIGRRGAFGRLETHRADGGRHEESLRERREC
jgi:hypothetical protein